MLGLILKNQKKDIYLMGTEEMYFNFHAFKNCVVLGSIL